MNETQAKALAGVYESMGYLAMWDNTGGGVYLVYVSQADGGKETVFGYDTVSQFPSGTSSEATSIINL